METFCANLEGYLRHPPENSGRIRYLEPGRSYRFGLAYSYFLAETYVLLPYLEEQKIPFNFVFYPGGASGLNNPGSDAMLTRVLASPVVRRVIVTQTITEKYPLDMALCSAQQVETVDGGFTQFTDGDVRPRHRRGTDKSTFDLCFVAAEYSHQGRDKGYDLFVAAAHLLAEQFHDVRCHVVGGVTEEDVEVTTVRDRFTFYGWRQPEFLAGMYARMDVCPTPSRASVLYPGNFDGFPLGVDAAYCGAALFVSDPLEMNDHWSDGRTSSSCRRPRRGSRPRWRSTTQTTLRCRASLRLVRRRPSDCSTPTCRSVDACRCSAGR